MIFVLGNRGGVARFRHYISVAGRNLPEIRVYENITPILIADILGRDSYRFHEGTYLLTGLNYLDHRSGEKLHHVLSRLRKTPLRVRFVNEPMTFPGRYELLRLLRQAGVNWHDAYRLDEHRRPVSWPVFVRSTWSAWMSPLLKDQAALDAFVAQMIADGRWRADKLIVEYSDFRDADGLYRRYSAYGVGDRIVPGIPIFGRHWCLHTVPDDAPEMLRDPDLLREGMAHIEAARCADQVRRIFELARIGYGRMDYAVVDGRVQVFEINSAPDLIRANLFTPSEAPLRPMVERISAGLHDAFAALDSPV